MPTQERNSKSNDSLELNHSIWFDKMTFRSNKFGILDIHVTRRAQLFDVLFLIFWQVLDLPTNQGNILDARAWWKFWAHDAAQFALVIADWQSQLHSTSALLWVLRVWRIDDALVLGQPYAQITFAYEAGHHSEPYQMCHCDALAGWHGHITNHRELTTSSLVDFWLRSKFASPARWPGNMYGHIQRIWSMLAKQLKRYQTAMEKTE